MRKLFVSIAAIALTVASLFPKPALAGDPNLQYVGNSEGGDAYLLDYNSLKRNGAMIEYSYGVRYNSIHYDDQNLPSVGQYQMVRANCLTGKLQFTGSAAYGPGWVVTKSSDTLSSIMQIHVNSVGAMVLAAACQAQESIAEYPRGDSYVDIANSVNEAMKTINNATFLNR